jgi:hypothetical protein
MIRRRTKINNCFVCLLTSKFDFLYLFFPVRGCCEHSRFFRSSRPVYFCSKPTFFVDVLISISQISILASYFFNIRETCQHNIFICLILTGDCIFTSTTVTLSILYQITVNAQVLEFRAWTKLFQKRKLYNFNNMINDRETRKLVEYKEVIMFLNFFIAFCVFLSYCFVFYDTAWGNFFRKSLIITCYNLQWYFSFYFTQKVKVVGLVLKSLKRNLKSALNFDKVTVLSLEKYLQRQSNFLLVVNINIRLFMQYMTMILIIWCFSTVICLIHNIYTLIKCSHYDLFTLILLQCRTVNSIVQILILMDCADRNLRKKVSHIFTIFVILLFRYFINPFCFITQLCIYDSS